MIKASALSFLSCIWSILYLFVHSAFLYIGKVSNLYIMHILGFKFYRNKVCSKFCQRGTDFARPKFILYIQTLLTEKDLF